MNLQHLSESNLRSETLSCSKRERHETALLIEHLIEIERRKLAEKWGFGSLYDYLMTELGYEKGAASLRVSAVRAAQAVSDLPQKIETGELCLKTIRQVESFAYHEAQARGKDLTKTEKKQIYAEVANLSALKAETRLAEMSTSPKYIALPKEQDRAVIDSKRFISFSVTKEEYEFVLLAKEVLSHKYPGASTAEVFKLAVKDLVKRRHPKFKAERAMLREQKQAEVGGGQELEESDASLQKNIKDHSAHPGGQEVDAKAAAYKEQKRSRYIPAKDTHALWASYDGGGCYYTDSQTGQRCGSKHRLEKDHRKPFALGGENKKENLQILCRRHNSYKAQVELGDLVDQHNVHRTQAEFALLRDPQF